jgi:uncharacterized protein (TIGR03066 family)
MRTKTVVSVCVVAVALLGAGCDSDNKGKIEGTKWSSNAGTIKGQQLTSGQIVMEFFKDGTMELSVTDRSGNRKAYPGNYTLGIGDIVVFNLDKELAGMKTHAEHISIKNGELTMTDSDGTSGVFSRRK